MKKIPKELLDSIEPANREAFKKVYAKTMHLSSPNFLIQWSIAVFSLLFGVLYSLLSIFPAALSFFHAELIPTSVILSFMSIFPFNFFTKSIRLRLNQVGIYFIHGYCILLAGGLIFFAVSLKMELL